MEGRQGSGSSLTILEKEKPMRFLIKVSLPVAAGNAAAKKGFKAIPSILEELKPEAA